MTYFGTELKRVRKALGLSQGKMGEAAGVDQPCISKIENGLSLPENNRISIYINAIKQYSIPYAAGLMAEYLKDVLRSSWFTSEEISITLNEQLATRPPENRTEHDTGWEEPHTKQEIMDIERRLITAQAALITIYHARATDNADAA